MCIAPLYSTSNENYISFHQSVASLDFMKGIDNQSATTDDEVYALATNVWNEVSSTTTIKEDMIFSFV